VTRRPILVLSLLIAGCGGSHPVTASKRQTVSVKAPRTQRAAVAAIPAAQALVTAETANRLIAVDLPNGRVVARAALPADPEDIAAGDRLVVVVSPRAGKVTVLRRGTLQPVKTFGGLAEPHITAISPDGQHAYVTDDARGTLTIIRLTDLRVTSTVSIGAGAHHMTFSPNQRRLWVALGEAASRIAILDTSDVDRPRLIGHFSTGFPVHDLSFSPDGRRLWVSSASGPDVSVFDAGDRRLLFRVPVGPPPQHLAFDGPYAYVTSGYGSTIEQVDAANGRVLVRSPAPYGSFELAAADGYVVSSSLLRGTLAIYSPALRLLRVVNLAPATRELVISRP
jgi:DNA-binding beta-propeller fold protein YncE